MTDRVNIFVTGKTYDKCPEDSCTIVNVKHYEHLKDAILKWRPDGYVTIFYKDNNAMKAMPLHRYVVGVLEGKEIPVNHVVHHKVPNRYDNDINNLEVVTYAQNNAAIVRPKKSSETIFKGIYFCKLQNAWVAMINYKRRAYNLGAFLNETEAALKYDSAFYAIYRSKIGSNELLDLATQQSIEQNIDAYLPVARNDNRGLPKYVVQLPSGSYRVRIRPRKIDTTFQTLQEAKDYIQQYSQTQERDKNNTLILQPIVRNADGCPVINVVSKGNTYYALVDEDDYYKLIQRKWALDKSGYAVTGYDLMHRIVMNCNNLDGSVIDHINTNKLDNRKQNLRFTTDSFNIRNRAKRTNCSSKYTGVYWRKDRGKWGAYITIKGVRKSLGCYDSEEEAAKAYRDELAVIESQETANTDDALKAKLSMVE